MSDQSVIERNKQVIETFRANGGQIPGFAPLILLSTKGVKSGQIRISPLIAIPHGDSYLAVASNGGLPGNPLWYNNLIANPEVTVEFGNETFAAIARLLTGDEYTQAFSKAVAAFPGYGEYQKNITRAIPVFFLERLTK